MVETSTRRTVLLGAGLGLVHSGMQRTALATASGPAGTIFTADELGGTLSAIDLASGSVTKTTTSISPHNVQYEPRQRLLLAVGDLLRNEHTKSHAAHGSSAGGRTGRLVFYDAARLSSGPTAEIELDGHPAHVVVDPAGRTAFVTLAATNSVAIVDLAARSIAGQVAAGRFPHGLRMSPDGREVCVANVRDGTISFIVAAAREELARVRVGVAPVQVAYSADGGRVHVSLRDENSVATVDRKTRALIARTPVGPKPIQTYVSPDGRWLLVANQGSDTKPNDTVSIIATDTLKVKTTVRTGRGAHGVVVSDDSAWAFVSNLQDGSVSVIDLRELKVVRHLAVGKGPNGITYAAA